jgi:hypothetical protein
LGLIGLTPVDRVPNMNIFGPPPLLLVAKSGRNHFGYMLQCGGVPIIGTMPVKAVINAVLPLRMLRSCVADGSSSHGC